MKEKRPSAVALGYDAAQDAAPKVLAKGKGKTAERIIEIARENEIPIYEDPDLVGLLGAIDLLDEVPPELYPAVAEVLAWVYRTGRN